MNIIHLISNPHHDLTSRIVLDLCKAFEKQGHSTAVVSKHRNPDIVRPFTEAGIAVGHLPLRKNIDFISPIMLRSILDRMERPVVIHTHSENDALIALRAKRLLKNPEGVKVVYSRHEVLPASTSRNSQAIYRDVDALTVSSEVGLKAFLSTALPIIRQPGRVALLAPTLAPLPYPGEKLRERKDAPVRFIFIGPLDKESGIDIVVEALTMVNAERPGKAALTVCGAGNSRFVMPIVRKARAEGVDSLIEWKGRLEDTSPEVLRADAGIIPASSYGLPGVAAFDFFSHGMPVITAMSNARALALNMIRLIDLGPHKIAQEGADTASDYLKTFDFDSFLKKTIDIYSA